MTQDYGNTLTLPNGNTISLPHANLSLNKWNRVVISMEDGWVYYSLDMYPEDTAPEDICYSRYGVFSPDTNFDNFVIIDESTIDPEQIYR